MYEIIKTVIETGEFELTDILKKIDVQWVSGRITDEERIKLIQLAQEKASVHNSVNMDKVLEKLAEHDKEIKAIRELLASKDKDEGSSEDAGNEEVPEENVEEYPEYVAGKWYYNGGKCSENGKNYNCIAPEGVVCVWSPSEYPAYWQEVIEVAVEEE